MVAQSKQNPSRYSSTLRAIATQTLAIANSCDDTVINELEDHMFKLSSEMTDSQLKTLLAKATSYINNLNNNEKDLKAVRRVDQ